MSQTESEMEYLQNILAIYFTHNHRFPNFPGSTFLAFDPEARYNRLKVVHLYVSPGKQVSEDIMRPMMALLIIHHCIQRMHYRIIIFSCLLHVGITTEAWWNSRCTFQWISQQLLML